MTSAITPASSQAPVSAQLERARNDRPAPAEPPRPRDVQQQEPPPRETGRGQKVDRSA